LSIVLTGVTPFMSGAVPMIALGFLGFDTGKRLVVNVTSSQNILTAISSYLYRNIRFDCNTNGTT